MEYKQAFHKEYLRKQHIYDYTLDCDVDHDNILLLDEGKTYWLVKIIADGQKIYICVIWKKNAEGYSPRPMEIIKL